MMRMPSSTSTHRHRRRGAVYVVVLGAALMLTVIGLAGLKLTRVKSRTVTCTKDGREAGILALSAIEQGLATLDAGTVDEEANWRTIHTSRTQSAEVTIGRGTLQWMLVDERDDDLGTISSTDPVRLYGIGRVGDITRVYSVLLEARGSQGLDALSAALHSNAQFWIDYASDTLTVSGAPASTNGAVSNYGTIAGDLDADRITRQGTITGTITEPAPAKAMPAASVYDYYVAAGTKIDRADLPLSGGNLMIDNVLLSPASNPYGQKALNRQGIYVLDCAGQDLHIRNVRVVGTLVVLNCGGYLYLSQGYNWEPAVPNYPALLIHHVNNGSQMQIQSTQTTLSETAGSNFNPVGTPYAGIEDSDTLDAYPSLFKGLLYTNSNLYVWADFDVHGALLCAGWFELNSADVDVQHDSIYFTNPPPGFSGNGPMVPMPGTWTRTTLPP